MNSGYYNNIQHFVVHAHIQNALHHPVESGGIIHLYLKFVLKPVSSRAMLEVSAGLSHPAIDGILPPENVCL